MATPYERAESTNRGLGVLRRRGSVTLEGIEDLLAQGTDGKAGSWPVTLRAGIRKDES